MLKFVPTILLVSAIKFIAWIGGDSVTVEQK